MLRGTPAVSDKGPASVQFGIFSVDLRAGELCRNGLKVKLQEQPFQILSCLLERPGQVVTREELQKRLWPADTYVDFDHGLNAAVRRLRDALGDSADNPRFVETVGRRGYRFLAPVNGVILEPQPRDLVAVASLKQRVQRLLTGSRSQPSTKLLVVVVALTFLAIVGVVLTALKYGRQGGLWVWSQPGEYRLTANPREAPIWAAFISPDGKFLIYCDPTGLYLRQVKSVEASRVTLPKGFSACPSGWFADSVHYLISAATGQQGQNSIWKMSILGGSPQTLADNGFGATASRDGLHIAFLREGPEWGTLGREVWLTQSNGQLLQKISEAPPSSNSPEWGRWFGPVAWSPSGRQVSYTLYRQGPGAVVVSLLTEDVQSGQTRILLTGKNLGSSVCWTSDGQLLYVLNGAPDLNESSAWSVYVDPNTGEAKGRARRLTTGLGVIGALSSTVDGKKLALLRNDTQYQVFTADFDPATKKLMEPRRLSLDSRENAASAWTRDSSAVLFFSNRTGSFTIYKQAINQPTAEQLIDGPGDRRLPRLSPNGSEIVYVEALHPENPTAPSTLMRMPVNGGVPQVVIKEAGITNFECARLPSQLCVFSTQIGDTTTFFSFDLMNGRRQQIARITGEPYGYNWGLSPNGSSIALIKFDEKEGRIRFLTLSDGKLRDFAVGGWGRLYSVDWSADGTAILAPSLSSKGSTALLQINMHAQATVLWEGGKDFNFGWTIPSPDGRHVVFNGRVGENNVWSIENR